MQGMNDIQPQSQDQAPQRQATDEQQAQYNKFYAKTVELLFNEQFLQAGAKLLQQAPTVVDGMARIGATVASRVYMQAAKEGAPPEPIVVIESGREIMAEVADFAKALEYEVSDEDIETAYYMAADLMRQTLVDAGVIDEEAMLDEASELGKSYPPDQMQPITDKVAAARAGIGEAIRGGAQQ